MEEYKKSVENQHAPEALIQATLKRIQEEETKMPENLPEKKIRKFPVTAVAGMAAAVLVLVGVTRLQSGSDIYYNQISDSIIKAETGFFSEEKLNEEIETYYYEADGVRLMVQTSKNNQLAPKELIKGESSQIGNVEVYVGEIKENNRYVAAFEKDGIFYYIVGNNIEKKTFEKNLKKVKPLAK